MRTIIALTVLLALGACGQTSLGSAVRDQVKVRGAEIFDEGLENAEFFICHGASVGSVMRRYGSSQNKALAWRTLCTSDPDAVDGLFGIRRQSEGEG